MRSTRSLDRGPKRQRSFSAGPSTGVKELAQRVGSLGHAATALQGNLTQNRGADHPEAGCVIHTHSPYATAFAVARRRIDCWIEALAMFGLADGVRVAEYGPRGSAQAVRNIRAAISPGGCAVLLANHGVLVFHRTPANACVSQHAMHQVALFGR